MESESSGGTTVSFTMPGASRVVEPAPLTADGYSDLSILAAPESAGD